MELVKVRLVNYNLRSVADPLCQEGIGDGDEGYGFELARGLVVVWEAVPGIGES